MDLRFDGVRFLRGKRQVLDIEALEFAPGRVTAVVGPNGAGKTTLLRLAAGLETPATGTVTIGGEHAGKATRQQMAFAFQKAVFLAGSLRANFDLALRLRGVAPAERPVRIEAAAAACSVADLLDRNAQRLSGGEAQRANLARTLALRAPVTLLDEPLAGIDDPGHRRLLFRLPELLREFVSTAVFVTHDRDEAVRIADDLVVLMEGRVRAAGRAVEVYRRPPDAETAGFLGYTILPGRDGVRAVRPGALRAGAGEVTFQLTVETVREAIGGLEAAGLIEGERVVAPLPAGQPAPTPGAVIEASAEASAVLSFGR